jgi:hypothetical protein
MLGLEIWQFRTSLRKCEIRKYRTEFAMALSNARISGTSEVRVRDGPSAPSARRKFANSHEFEKI